MAIRLDKPPSTDGLGVKRWTYDLDETHVLHVYERPPQYAPHATRFLLQLFERDISFIAASFATSKSEAARLARYIARDVAELPTEPAFQIIIRAEWEPGIRGELARRMLPKRGLWLSKDSRHA